MQFSEDSFLYSGMILTFANIFGCQKPKGVIMLLWFVCSELFVQIISQIRITFRNESKNCLVHRLNELGLLRCDYGEFNNWCIFFIDYGICVVLVILTAVFWSNIVDIEWAFSALTASINFPYGVTVRVVLQSYAWSTNAVIVLVIIAGTAILW